MGQDNKLKSNLRGQMKKVDTGVKDGVYVYTNEVTLGQFTKEVGINANDIIKKWFLEGKMVTLNTTLTEDQIGELCLENDLDFRKEIEVTEENLLEELNIVDKEEELEERPPVVTIMGHVDHGKTTLLDTIRKSKVTEGEFGGITQHIGAYQVERNGKKITFLDTPGHESFTAMRARGAQVTDVVIIVVAWDDAVMPQTIEAIDHAKAANVPIIVAVNKMDKPGADAEKVMTEMTEHGLVAEQWGGDTIFIPISALKGEGVEDLLDNINLIAEVQDFKANKNRHAIGTVIESHLDKGKGSVATVLIETGTLRIGDPVVVGSAFGRVRTMEDDLGLKIKTAGPSTPVVITGMNDVPGAGDKFMAFANEKAAKSIAEKRNQAAIQKSRNHSRGKTLEELSKEIAEGDIKQINVMLKCDVHGTVEALKHAINKVDVEGARVNILRASVGAINESDILLASASSALIYGFNVRPTGSVKKKADESGVEIRLHTIIYKIQEELEEALKGMLDAKMEEKTLGQAEIREIFTYNKSNIAGCSIIEGKMKSKCNVRLIRDGIVIYTGNLGSLQRGKDQAKEVQKGMECGMTVDGYNDIKIGDIIEGYEIVEVK